jgi:outer membrane protein OmpA-like peptidoglycan-associated protein
MPVNNFHLQKINQKMAELNVQPKKKKSILPWILLLLGAAVLIWFLTRNRGEDDVANRDTATDTVTTATTGDGINTASDDWRIIDFNAPAVAYDEITDKNINVRGNNSYGIYGLGENILFDEGKATIRSDAEANLKQIAGSIGKRYNGGEIRVKNHISTAAPSNKRIQGRIDFFFFG